MDNTNISNNLSLYRILVAPVIILLCYLDQKTLVGAMISLSLLSDALDGFLARNLHIESKLGAKLDSTGDILNFVAATFAILYFEIDFVRSIKQFLFLGFGVYVLEFFASIVRYGKISGFHTYLRKLAAIFQGILFVYFLFFEPVAWIFFVTFGVTIIALLEEIILVILLPDWQTDVKGLPWAIRKKKRGNE
jgi:CDP-diacylglycerol--glycerol-3-phosphate 3-phosphatidyltransferase